MKRIVYVGAKEQKGDNIAQTGLHWSRGQIHEVADDKKADMLLAHTSTWKDADQPYDLAPAISLASAPPEPKVSIIPHGGQEVSPFWEPVVITVQGETFMKLKDKALIAVFMTKEDADAYDTWKLDQLTAPDDAKTKAKKTA